jgi:hypothetical protein
MAIFDGIDVFEIAAFFFIFGALGVYTGSATAFSQSVLPLGMSSFMSVPFDFVVGIAHSGYSWLLPVAALLFLVYFKVSSDFMGPAFWAAILFGYLALMLLA